MTWQGGFFDLLTPFPLLCGLTSVAMLTMHGGTYLALKTEAPVTGRATRYAGWAALALLVLFTICGIWLALATAGQAITAGATHNGVSNPLAKEVSLQPGAWFANYQIHRWLMLAPLLGYAGALLVLLALRLGRPGFGFIVSSLSVAGVVTTVGVSLFPFLMPSSLEPRSGLTVWDASSSPLTLFIMLIATLIFIPLILAYTAWVFRVLKGKVTAAHVEGNREATY